MLQWKIFYFTLRSVYVSQHTVLSYTAHCHRHRTQCSSVACWSFHVVDTLTSQGLLKPLDTPQCSAQTSVCRTSRCVSVQSVNIRALSNMVCGGFTCSQNALCSLNVVYMVSVQNGSFWPLASYTSFGMESRSVSHAAPPQTEHWWIVLLFSRLWFKTSYSRWCELNFSRKRLC